MREKLWNGLLGWPHPCWGKHGRKERWVRLLSVWVHAHVTCKFMCLYGLWCMCVCVFMRERERLCMSTHMSLSVPPWSELVS